MDEERKAPRHRVLKAGTITFGGGGISCTVRNFSDTGAALDVISPVEIPDAFTLALDVEATKLRCRVVGARKLASA
jgi:hypothetical protein